jgi:CDP-diacylglycerol pyrophosphatase
LVSTECVPNEVQHSDPKPCASVDLKDGYVILKDRRGLTQYLLIPPIRVTGIESAYLLTPGAPNYFADAWRKRGYVERAAPRALPQSAISLAINSAKARSQNQLHIHIDCIRTDVREVLRRELAVISSNWAPLSEPLVAGHHYRAMRVLADTLDGTNPVTLLADGIPRARMTLGQQSLVVVGAEFAAG